MYGSALPPKTSRGIPRRKYTTGDKLTVLHPLSLYMSYNRNSCIAREYEAQESASPVPSPVQR